MNKDELEKVYEAVQCHSLIAAAIKDLHDLKGQFDKVPVILDKLNGPLRALHYSAETVYRLEGINRKLRDKDFLKAQIEDIKKQEAEEAKRLEEKNQLKMEI